MDCKHNHLWRLEGPLHDTDNPPQYRCEDCKVVFAVTLDEPKPIGVSYGTPKAD
jgi:hypothetical protein